MSKDILISALAAGLILRHPWIAVCTAWQQASIWLGLTVCLLFFCLFCEERYEKWVKYRERVGRIRELVTRLKRGERNEK